VLATRLRAIVAVDARELLRVCSQSVLYVASSSDAMVSQRNVDEIVSIRRSVKVVTVAGPHLAMYVSPHSAARVIGEFIAEVNNRADAQ
jgi:hypothetical protein